MVRIEFIKAATVTSDEETLMLCESTRSLAESNIRFNGQSVLQPVQFLRAEYATVFDRGNQRNTISFDVRRDVDFNGELFPDVESALLFAFDLPARLRGVGVLKVELQGYASSYVRWMANAAVESVALTDPIGLNLGYAVVVSGGEITESEP